MKKILLVLLAMGMIYSSVLHSAVNEEELIDGGDGTIVGSGGSIVGDLTADLFYLRETDNLPDDLIELDWDEHKKLAEELEKTITFISARHEFGKFDPNSNYRFIKPSEMNLCFYKAPRLSGKDELKVSDDLEALQVAFSYHYTEYADDFSSSTDCNVIELKEDLFFNLPIRTQALILIHELMHIKYPRKGHNIISPFIKALYHTQNVSIEASKDSGYVLTDVERKQVNILRNLFYILDKKRPSPSYVTKNGAIVSSWSKEHLEQTRGEIKADFKSHITFEENAPVIRDLHVEESNVVFKKFAGRECSNLEVKKISPIDIICSGDQNRIESIPFIKNNYLNMDYKYEKSYNVKVVGNNNSFHYSVGEVIGSNNTLRNSDFKLTGNNNIIESSFLNNGGDLKLNNGLIQKSYLTKVDLHNVSKVIIINSKFEDMSLTNNGHHDMEIKDSYLSNINILNRSGSNLKTIFGLRIDSRRMNDGLDAIGDDKQGRIEWKIRGNKTSINFDKNNFYHRAIRSKTSLFGFNKTVYGPQKIDMKDHKVESFLKRKYRVARW